MHDPYNAFADRDPAAHAGEGALEGVTLGIKANIAVKGLPWSAGMELYRHRIGERDALAVAQLRGAGAVIVGTLNMEEAALGAKTDNPWFGPVQNPHRAGYSPGGSSGGSAAAVAAGLCEAALGTDTMGSIRIPAAYCGVYGFKPAHAAISQDGLELAEPSLDTIGPLARSLPMLERVARVISRFGEGSDAADGAATIAGLGGGECSPDVLTAFTAARATCENRGEAALSHPLSRIRFAGFIKTARAMAAHFADADQAKLSPVLKKLLSYGPARSDADWLEDQRILSLAAAEVSAIVSAHGAIILPTAPQSAFPHSQPAPANQADFTCIANIAGLPAISIPAGRSADGLPIGVQLIGTAGQEAGLFALASQIDTALNAYFPPAP